MYTYIFVTRMSCILRLLEQSQGEAKNVKEIKERERIKEGGERGRERNTVCVRVCVSERERNTYTCTVVIEISDMAPVEQMKVCVRMCVCVRERERHIYMHCCEISDMAPVEHFQWEWRLLKILNGKKSQLHSHSLPKHA